MTAVEQASRPQRLHDLAAACLPDVYREFAVEPLGGGYLHDSLVVTHAGGRSVFKVFNTALEHVGTPPVADIVANTRRAGEAGVGARVIAEFPDVAAVVIEHIDGRTLEIADVQEPRTLDRVVDACRALHTGCEPFTARFDPFEWHRSWRRRCVQNAYAMPAGDSELADGMARIEAALAVDPPPLVPAHGDLLPANILATATEIRLIDYDYAGMAEPAWDLGGLAAENQLPLEAIETCCRRYWGAATGRDVARVRLYATVLHIAYGSLVWALRGAMPDLLPADVWQALDEEFTERWEIAAAALRAPEFERLLAEARDG